VVGPYPLWDTYYPSHLPLEGTGPYLDCLGHNQQPTQNNGTDPQVASEIRAKKSHITHVNTMEPFSFWCSKLGCVFLLYSSIYIDLLHEKYYITCLINATYKKN
jgi:hypothetical protein